MIIHPHLASPIKGEGKDTLGRVSGGILSITVTLSAAKGLKVEMQKLKTKMQNDRLKSKKQSRGLTLNNKKRYLHFGLSS